MALAEEIRTLRDRVLAELDSDHDYYTDTKIAWRLVHKIIAAGHKFTVRNTTTGTVTTHTDLAAKAREYVAKQLTEATFQHVISTFEIERVAEAKASRDALVHNKGIASRTYETKAGRLARFKDGERIDVPEQYHRETWELIRKLVSDLSNAAIAKAL